MRRPLRPMLIAVALIALAAHVATASASDADGNLIANPGAESGATAPWIGSGWGVEKYGAPSAPTVEYSQRAESGVLGSYLFNAVSPNASIEQSVSLEELSSSIESGSEKLSFAAWLGGQASGGSSTATVVFRDGTAHTIGSSVQLGPIVASELAEQPTLMSCRTVLKVPIGARSASVVVAGAAGNAGATSYGIADNALLSTTLRMIPESGGYGLYPSATANCSEPGLAPPEPPVVPAPVVDPSPAQVSAPGESLPTLGLEKITTDRGSAFASVTCAGSSGPSCRGRIALRTVLRRNARRSAVTTNIGSVPISLDTGQQATVAIHLNAVGRRLLRTRHALHVTLIVFVIDGATRQIVAAARRFVLTS